MRFPTEGKLSFKGIWIELVDFLIKPLEVER